MADDKRDTPRPFDVRTVEHLVKLMSDHDLGEIDLTEGDQRLRLRKRAAFAPPTAAFAPVPFAAPAAAPAPSPAPAASAAPVPAAPTSKLLDVKSELPGTFYARPAPDKPEFVKVGSRVTPDTTVCLVIAMKVNNEIKAGCSGTIAEVCVKNEDYVEYGTVLFRVNPS